MHNLFAYVNGADSYNKLQLIVFDCNDITSLILNIYIYIILKNNPQISLCVNKHLMGCKSKGPLSVA